MDRSTRAAQRADRSGSGPTVSSPATADVRYPGAKSAFGLLGEVLLVGIVVAAASLPLVTLPAALAAGVRHLRRFIRAEESSMAQFVDDLRRGVLGGIGIGVVALLIAGVLLLDIDLAASGLLPGGPLISLVGWVGLAVLGLALFSAAGLWTPDTGWRAAVRAVPRAVASDPAGAGYLVATGIFATIVTWQLFPLVIPALGCVALAIVAVPERRRRSSGEAA
jgi:hypothetical protein